MSEFHNRSISNVTPPIIYACDVYLQRALGIGEEQSAEVVRILLEAGASANASITVCDILKSPLPALYFACTYRNLQVVELLLEHGADPNDGESLFGAAELNHRDCLDLFKAYGADLSSRHPHRDSTPLYFVAGHKQYSPLFKSSQLGIRWLLENGADPNVASYVKTQANGEPGISEMPLHRVAAYGKSAAVAKLLLYHGANVNMPRADGKTAYAMRYALATQRLHACSLLPVQMSTRSRRLTECSASARLSRRITKPFHLLLDRSRH